jgi:hypothetical protein
LPACTLALGTEFLADYAVARGLRIEQPSHRRFRCAISFGDR